ncbi:MAG: haloacid dehalogenase-like hydrolase [Thermoplasmata archaeon]|nr:haloacid dehalogenase-like hydrolase [Thermoplasmata archaeon]MCI4359977.1 haloacid dehalogenase-like hydrolase [Thermoplasmata archaeon]
MVRLPFDLVTVDIDGTLTLESGWKFFAEELARSDRYADLNDEYLAGAESENVHLRRLLTIAEGIPLLRLEGLMEATPKLKRIEETVRSLKEAGAHPVLLSHNPGYVSEWYARRFGFEDWDGTSHRSSPEVIDGVVGPPGEIVADKPGGLKRLVGRYATSPGRVAHVGDGPPDATIFQRVGFGVAMNATLPEVARAANASLRTSDFGAILEALRTAHPRPVPAITL